MKFIVGNWKANGNKNQAGLLINAISKLNTNNKIILCLPFTLLNVKTNGVYIGAQDVSAFSNGAYTGDISAQMLSESGINYVIIGHSERRIYHKETIDIIKKKISLAIESGLTPIICMGENAKDKKEGKTDQKIISELNQILPNNGNFIIAYEPQWAIGTGLTPTISEIKSAHTTIHNLLKSKGLSKNPIIYGGSVSIDNAAKIAKVRYIDGLLIGKASLKKETFVPIIESIR